MEIVLLSGGSGKRLWPLSNGVRSKQFIKCLKKEDGSYESMLQRIVGQISDHFPRERFTVVTSRPQVSAVLNQLGEGIGICAEPAQQDVFSAVCLVSFFLRDVKGVDPEECVAVCPTDTFVSDEYFRLLMEMEAEVQAGWTDLAMTAIRPTYPSEKYGYLLCEGEQKVRRLWRYCGKPDEKTASGLIGQGALWNGGIFVVKLGFLLELCTGMTGYADYEEVFDNYRSIPKGSLEEMLIRRADSAQVFVYEGEWRTLGTWNTLTEAMEDVSVGNALFDENCKNVHVVNELDVPVLCMGLEDLVVSASPEGILVSDKTHSSYIAPFVEQIDQRIMFADKSWGSYRVLDAEDESMTIKVTLNPGHSMNYHSHERRDEVWTIICGQGRTIVDGMEQPVKAGDVITMEAGCRHTIIADTQLHLIEVQLGKEISVHDKKKYEYEI